MSWPFIPRLYGNGGGTLNAGIREQLKKLAERLIEPRIPASKLRGASDRYKIRLRAADFRLVHEYGITRCWCLW